MNDFCVDEAALANLRSLRYLRLISKDASTAINALTGNARLQRVILTEAKRYNAETLKVRCAELQSLASALGIAAHIEYRRNSEEDFLPEAIIRGLEALDECRK